MEGPGFLLACRFVGVPTIYISTAPLVSLLVTPEEPLKTVSPRATVLANEAPNNSPPPPPPSSLLSFFRVQSCMGETEADCQRVTSRNLLPTRLAWFWKTRVQQGAVFCQGLGSLGVGRVERRAVI